MVAYSTEGEIQRNLDLETLNLEHSVPVTKLLFMLRIYLALVHSLDLETSTTATETNILENRRRVMKKNVAILADSLPLSASRHNTMFLKNWQHLL